MLMILRLSVLQKMRLIILKRAMCLFGIVWVNLVKPMLPPKGKYLDPLELMFNNLKEHYVCPAFPNDGSDLSFTTLNDIVSNYMLNVTLLVLPEFFRAHANG